MTLGLGAGLRRGEMYGLRWADVDFDAAVLRIRQTLDAMGRFAEPKTARSRRDVSVPPFVVECLKRHRTAQIERRMKLGAAWNDHDLVLEKGDGSPCDVGEAGSHAFKRLARRIGMGEVRLHDLRHGFATVSLTAGTPLAVISAAMGHATYAITADIYAHVVREVQTEAADRLEAILGNGSDQKGATNGRERLPYPPVACCRGSEGRGRSLGGRWSESRGLGAKAAPIGSR